MKVSPLFKRVLSVLFKLKYVEGITDMESLASMLDLPVSLAERFSKSLDEYLRAKLNVITPERLSFVCPECLEARVYEDPETGERVCTSCGFVLGSSEAFDSHLPFDTTYALTSELSFGKSLGGTLGYKGLLRVLARSPVTKTLVEQNSNSNLGIRARSIQVIAETAEPPALQAALAEAEDLKSLYGLDGDYVFSNTLGYFIRRAFWLVHYFLWKKELSHVFKRQMSETCFLLALKAHGKTALAEHFRANHRVNPKLELLLEEIEPFLESVIRRAQLREQVLKAFPSLEATA